MGERENRDYAIIAVAVRGDNLALRRSRPLFRHSVGADLLVTRNLKRSPVFTGLTIKDSSSLRSNGMTEEGGFLHSSVINALFQGNILLK
jgi:hypothetical protein